MYEGTAYISVPALPVDGIVCCVLPVLPFGRPSSLLSLCTFVFFFFSCLFVLPIFKAQTNNYDSLPKCRIIKHNLAGGWRLCGIMWTSIQRHCIDVHATLFGCRLLDG